MLWNGNEFTQELYPWVLDSRVWVSIEIVIVDWELMPEFYSELLALIISNFRHSLIYVEIADHLALSE